MSETTYTPGPWEVHYADGGEVWVQETRTPERIVICDIPGDMETIGAEQLRNADLIAAAPDLYRACELALPEIRCLFMQKSGRPAGFAHGSVGEAMDALAAAIAKARGEEATP